MTPFDLLDLLLTLPDTRRGHWLGLAFGLVLLAAFAFAATR